MPLKGNYQWSDAENHVIVKIPLKGVSPSKIDILATTSTLKVNYLPYLIDIVLSKPIDALKHKARVKDGVLFVTLFKTTAERWEQLELGDEDVVEKERVRQEALIKHQELESDLDTKRKDKKIADERFSTRKQMALEENERNRLETKKEEEKKTAEQDLYATFANMESKQEDIKSQKVKFSSSHLDSIEDISEGEEDQEEQEEMIEEVYSSTSTIEYKPLQSFQKKSTTHSLDHADAADDADIKYIPPPRRLPAGGAPGAAGGGGGSGDTAKVGITFTPRIFPTPMRESKQAEEEDWIAKNRKYLSKHGQLGGKGVNRRGGGGGPGGGGDISEEDPVWLKAKADDFYRNHDYHSAINAYSSALEMDESYLACYLNRSLCYLQLSDSLNCLSDCRDGLKLIEQQLALEEEHGGGPGPGPGAGQGGPGPGEENEEMIKLKKLKLKLLFRHGICQCQLGEYAEAIHDYQTGLELMISLNAQHSNSTHSNTTTTNTQSSDQEIQLILNDIQKLQQLELCHEYKKNADTSFGQKNLEEALFQYSQALKIFSQHVGCLSNRAACKLALHDYEGCVDDCTLALNILNQTENNKINFQNFENNNLQMLHAIIPPTGSEKRKSWYLKTLVRRGATYFQLKRLDEAILDYGLACSLDPLNTSLKNDLMNLTNMRTATQHSTPQQTQQTN